MNKKDSKYFNLYKKGIFPVITRIVWPFYERAWKLHKLKNRRIFLIGQSHIDAAWVWRKRYTVNKIAKTFGNAVENMKRFPRFKFTASSPQYYLWMKIHFPDLFSEICEKIKEGRWEPIGGSWIEADCNIPSGESLCRQRLIGLRFYRDNFGIIPKVGWFLDSFGYTPGLPAILSKSGAGFFWTTKIKWNKNYRFPFNYFIWRAPDGSEVIAHSCEGGWGPAMFFGRHPENYILPSAPLKADYSVPYEKIMQALDNGYVQEIGIFYGKGDGGHGPLIWEIVEAESVANLKRYKISDATEFFGELVKYAEKMPIWKDALDLDIHTGTFTTQTYMKWLNRRAEMAITSAEKLFTFLYHNFGISYPQLALNSLWKVILLNQFHDILPGTSIPGVYLETYSELESLLFILYRLIHEGMKVAVNNSAGNNETEDNDLRWAIYNPCNFGFKTVVQIPIYGDERKFPDFAVLKDEEMFGEFLKEIGEEEDCTELLRGNLFGAESVDLTNPRYPNFFALSELNTVNEAENSNPNPEGSFDKFTGNECKVILLDDIETVPMGITVAEIKQTDAENEENVRIKLSEEKIELSNGRILAELDTNTGNLLNIERENEKIIREGSGCLKIYYDKFPKEPAWNIDPDYKNKEIPSPLNLIKYEIKESGPLRAAVTFTYYCNIGDGGKVAVTYLLEKYSPFLEICIKFDWYIRNIMTKMEFIPAYNTAEIIADTAYSIRRSLFRPKDKWDAVRIEKPCHKYIAAVPDDPVGRRNIMKLALLTYDKYGFDHTDGKISLTLLRTPEYPKHTALKPHDYDPFPKDEEFSEKTYPPIPPEDRKLAEIYKHTDLGFSYTRIAVLPYKETDELYKNALRFNTDLYCIPIRCGGNLHTIPGLIEVSPDFIEIGALKKAEDDDGIIIRLYNPTDKEVHTEIRIKHPDNGVPSVKADEVDIPEFSVIREIGFYRDTVPLDLKGYEFKTLKLTLNRVP